jgi:hypothetical protein
MRQLSRRTSTSASSAAYQSTTGAPALTTELTEGSPAPDRLAYTMEEFCRAARIGRSLGYGEIAAGRLKVVRVGRRTLVTVDSAKAWLASLPEGMAGEPIAPRQARLARQRSRESHTDCLGDAPLGGCSKSDRTQPKHPSIRSWEDGSTSA